MSSKGTAHFSFFLEVKLEQPSWPVMGDPCVKGGEGKTTQKELRSLKMWDLSWEPWVVYMCGIHVILLKPLIFLAFQFPPNSLML